MKNGIELFRIKATRLAANVLKARDLFLMYCRTVVLSVQKYKCTRKNCISLRKNLSFLTDIVAAFNSSLEIVLVEMGVNLHLANKIEV